MKLLLGLLATLVFSPAGLSQDSYTNAGMTTLVAQMAATAGNTNLASGLSDGSTTLVFTTKLPKGIKADSFWNPETGEGVIRVPAGSNASEAFARASHEQAHKDEGHDPDPPTEQQFECQEAEANCKALADMHNFNKNNQAAGGEAKISCAVRNATAADLANNQHACAAGPGAMGPPLPPSCSGGGGVPSDPYEIDCD